MSSTKQTLSAKGAAQNAAAFAAEGGEGAEPKSGGGVFRGLKLILLALVAAAGLVFGYTWYREAPLRRAEKMLDEKQPEEALKYLGYFLESQPDHERGLALKARALSDLGRAKESLELFDRVAAETTAEMRSWARAYMATAAWSKALPLLQHVVSKEPTNADALYELTSCRLRMGLLDEALASAKMLAEQPGHEAEGNITLATIYNDLGNLELAIESFAKATDYSPDGAAFPMPANDVFFQYGSVLLTRGRAEEAAEVLEKSITNRPSSIAYLAMGDALSQAGRTPEAIDAWKMSLQLDIRNARAREALANAALVDNDAQAGLEYLEPLVAAGQVRQSTAYLLQRLHTRLGDAAEAEKWKKQAGELRSAEEKSNAIEQLLVRSPRSFWASVIRAHRFASQGNWEEALGVIEPLYADEAARQDPFVADLYRAIKSRGELPSLDRVPIMNK